MDDGEKGEDPSFEHARRRMVSEQLAARGITSPTVLAAMGKVAREAFVPRALRALAYDDSPLPLLYGATISQPYIVALMTELADVSPGDRVLEIGTGSGYQAAVLSELGAEVYGIEVIRWLAEAAERRLARLGYMHAHVRAGDGYQGWPEDAPYHAIVVTAAPPSVPPALVEQLAEGGRLVIPVGTYGNQELVVLRRRGDRIDRRAVAPVAFVPLRRTGSWDDENRHDAA